MGSQAQVKVIGHQAERQHAHGLMLTSAVEQLQERCVLVVVMEDRLALIAAVDHVVADATPGHAGASRHGLTVARAEDGDSPKLRGQSPTVLGNGQPRPEGRGIQGGLADKGCFPAVPGGAGWLHRQDCLCYFFFWGALKILVPGTPSRS